MKHHIFISSSDSAECVTDYLVDSDLSSEEVVLAAAMKTLTEDNEDIDNIENICVGKLENQRFGVMIVFDDYHLVVWENSDPVKEVVISEEYFKAASVLENNHDIYEQDDEMEALQNTINDFKEKLYGNYDEDIERNDNKSDKCEFGR